LLGIVFWTLAVALAILTLLYRTAAEG